MRSRAWADGACFAAGGLLFLAFSPWNYVLAAVVSVAVLFRALLRASPRRAFWRGWLYGLAGFGSGIWWIAESFQYVGIGVGVAASLTALLVVALALYPALFGWAIARLLGATARRPDSRFAGAAACWWLPAAWVLVEWLRGTLFSGFTWLQLGYAGLESPLAAYAPIGGSYAVGLAIAITAAGFAVVGVASNRSAVLALVVSALLWAGGIALDVLDANSRWTRPAGEALRVLVVQGNVSQAEKWSERTRPRTLDRYAGFTAGRPGADLVVWPETAIPYFAAQVRPFLEAAGEAAEQGGYVLLAGILTFDPASGRPYNSVARIATPGSVEPPIYHHKRYLVPFSERLPFETLVGPIASWIGYPVNGFEFGPDRQAAIWAHGHAIAVSICYEITFGAQSARHLGDAELLVNVSNDAWFGTTAGPHQHFQMARMRALELGRWLVRATNTGISALVTPAGRVAASAPQFQSAVLEVAVPPREGLTPYARWRDYPVLALLAALFLIGWRVRSPAGRGGGPVRSRASSG